MNMLDNWKMLGDPLISDKELGASLIEAARPYGLEGELLDRLEDVLLNVFGEPNDPGNPDEWRYGSLRYFVSTGCKRLRPSTSRFRRSSPGDGGTGSIRFASARLNMGALCCGDIWSSSSREYIL
jgi:hypothetical protein